MSHAAKAIVLHCMDFRFIHDVARFMKSQGLDGQYDDVGAAGAAKNIVGSGDASDKEFTLRQIALAKELHGVDAVYLINHVDCGAYGNIFSSPDDERSRHVRDLQTAKQIVNERFEGLTVKLFLASLDAAGNVSFEAIEENPSTES